MAKRRDDLNKRVELYGLLWQPHVHPVQRELDCIAHGGQWPKKIGGIAGLGNFFHFKEAIRLIWGDAIVQHRWFDFFLKHWLENKYVGVMGPKNSGKSLCAAIFHLIAYYARPTCTTIIVCSTTKEALEDRIWGEIKKYHRMAKERVEWLPGHLIEGRMRLITDDREESADGRDFRNGFVGVPCKKGNQYVGLSDFVGRKNKWVFLLGDEIQFLPAAFLDATANLDGSGGASNFKLTGMGNPSEITNSLGLLCEPSMALGGWESGIDQTPMTKAWATRINVNGISIQLPGSDCPNMDVPAGDPVPYPFLITRKQLEEDGARWGVDDWHYTMFDEGRMPRGQGSNRVITRPLCHRGHAMDDPIWKDSNRTRIASLDAAFRAVGGDRCVFTRAEFGMEAAVPLVSPQGELNLTHQDTSKPGGRVIFALIEQKTIPISAAEAKGAALTIAEAEDQIVNFVMRECKEHNIPPQNLFYDCGMKASLVQAFERIWAIGNPVDFDAKPTERLVSRGIPEPCSKHYFNFVTEMWYQTRMLIDAGQMRGLTESVMLEGCKREFMKVAGNKIQVEPKAEMKKKTGESPDQFDSLVIAFEGARQRGFQIAKFESTAQSEKDVQWKQEAMQKAKKLWRSGQLNYA